MKRVKVITSHTGLSRFLAECNYGAGIIPRQTQIPSPYSSGPTETLMRWRGKRVFYHEVRHKRYEVFEVLADMTIYQNEDEAVAAMGIN